MRLPPVVVVVLALGGCPKPPETPTKSNVVVSTVDAAPATQMSTDGLSPPLPTLRLPRNFVPVRYDARLALDPAKADFTGTIAIVGTVAERSSTIWLHAHDLTIAKAVATQGDPFDSRKAKDAQFTTTIHGNNWLELRAPTAMDPGTWTITIDYTGKLDTLNTAGAFKQVVGNAAYIYSQFEAVYARRVFPCFDEPDSKVPWKLTLDIPDNLVAASNTPIVKDEKYGESGKTKRVEFAQTKPLPSYLVAFAVGPFAIVDGGKTKGGTPVKIYALAGRSADAAWAAKSSAQILELTEDYFGIPYPYEKLDMVTIPLTVGFSAMENAGMITFTETRMLLGPKASKNQQRIWVVVAAHEIAHQWFGDFVTMQWWDDLWLNEGFATWLEHKTSAKFDASWKDEGNDIEERNYALTVDSLTSARKVRQPIESTDDIFTAFDGITYNKGASLLNMLETYVGPEVFQKGVHAYLESRAYGSATSNDLIAAIGKSANKDLTAMFGSFLDHAGAPEVSFTIECGKNKAAAIALAQHRYVPPGAPVASADIFTIPVCAAFESGGKRVEACTILDQATGSIPLPANACPRWVTPNVGARGYYRVGYTNAQLSSLRDAAWPLLSMSERRGIVFDARNGATIGKVPIALAMSFVPKLLAAGDRFSIGDATYLDAFEKHVPDELRPKYEQWVRTSFGPGATAVGLVPKPTDTLDEEQTRAKLVEMAAWTGRDPKLVEEAVRLSDNWTQLPEAVRWLVLRIAVDAKVEVFERVKKELYTEKDLGRRGEIVIALGAVRDPKRQLEALELILDTKLDIRETANLLELSATEANRRVAQEFFRKHQDVIMKRMPGDETAEPLANLADIFTASCDATSRDATVNYVTAAFAKLPGGERSVRQSVEEMDHCIAGRKLVEPELRGWLTGVKIPKPGKK